MAPPSSLPAPVRAGVAALVLAAAGLAGLVLVAPPAEAAGTFQAATSANTAGAAATSLQLGVPAGTAASDQLLAQVVVGGGSTVTITPPAGWTLVGSVSSGATAAVDLLQSVYRRTATASEPASYTWTFTSGRAAGSMLRYSGIDPDIPVSSTPTSAFTSGAGTNPSAPAGTASYASETVVHFVAKNDASTFTAASGTTERTDSGAVQPGTQSSDEVQAASGATAARTSTASSPLPASVVGQTVVLRTESAIKLRGVTLPATTAPTTSLALTPPAETSQYDVMVAQVVADRGAAITAPSGWTLALSTASGTATADIRQSVYYKVAGASETSAYTWTASQPLDGALLVYAGVDTANPLDGTASGQSVASGTTVTAPAITTTAANSMLLGFFACGEGRCDPITQPAGMNERVDTGQTPVVNMANGDFAFSADDKPLPTAGAVAAFSVTTSRTATGVGITMALRAAHVDFAASSSQAYEDAGTLSIAVSLSGVVSVPVSVSYAATGGTATSGSDYSAATGTVTIAPGATSASVPLTILDDANPDHPDGVTRRDETVALTLSSPHGANLGASTHTLTIKDDEPKVTVAIVDGAGGAASGAWGAWTASAGAADVASSNYLKVVNTHPRPEARPSVTVDFSASSLAGVADPAQTIALDGNVRYSCAEDATGLAAPSSLSFPAFGAASPTGSTTVAFTATTGSALYCRHQLAALPDPVLDQDYQAAFTVVAT